MNHPFLQFPGEHFSPDQVKPFPKAPARKGGRGGRKPGRCRILTDTPEKQEVEEMVRLSDIKKK